MTIDIIKSNPQINNMVGRIRNRRAIADALKNNNINVQTTKEKEDQQNEDKDQMSSLLSTSTDYNPSGSISGIDVQTVGPESGAGLTSSSIADAQAEMALGIEGETRSAGQIASDASARNQTFSDPYAKAFSSIGGREGAGSLAGTVALGALYAGELELAKGAFQTTQMLTGPAGMVLNVVGPSRDDPYGKSVAMGSGAFAKASSEVMDTHFSVADKVANGIVGYDQGYINGQLVSMTPGLFGLGSTLTGNVPQNMSAGMFSDLMNEARGREDEVAEEGGFGAGYGANVSGFTSPQAAMEKGGISVDSFTTSGGTVTDAAQQGIGYSSYSPDGNPTGAAPAGSQYSSTGTFSTGDDNNNNNDSNEHSDSSTDSGYSDYSFNDGGKVGMQMGGDPTQQQAPTGDMGFIGGPPDQFTPQQTIADDIPKEVPEGTFVINAPAVEFAGQEDIRQMLITAYEIVAQADVDAGVDRTAQASKIPSKEQVDIMISRGEVVVPPEIAKIIGYDKLEKINNRGKKEVSRRQEESQQQEKPQARTVAEGGFIGMQEGGNIEDEFGVTIKNVKFKDFYSSPEEARKEIDKILNNLPLEDALAIAMEGEADVLGDEGLEGVGHVFRNRARAEGYKDFGNSLAEELGKKTYGKNKIFQFNALEPTKFRNTLKRFKQNEDRYLKVRNIAEDIVAGSRKDFTKGALFFKNPTSSEAKDFKAKVQSGEYVETGRTVNPKNKVFAHIYYRPKDFSVVDETQPEIEQPINTESFATTNTATQPPRKIPESTGGSFLNRGSAYETGGATPAFR